MLTSCTIDVTRIQSLLSHQLILLATSTAAAARSMPPKSAPANARAGSAPLAPVNTTNEDEISPAHDSRRRSTREKHGVDRYKAEPSKLFIQPRFEFVPSNGWHPLVRQLNCKARNTLPWGLASDTARDGRGRIEVDESSLPEAPCPCWLLPVRDEIAEHVARLAPQLRAKGWKLLTCDVETIARLSNKGTLAEYAAKLGLSDHLPRHWNSPEKAVYPCLLKAAIGEHGQDIFIVKSAEEVHEHAPGGGFGSKWLLQELIPGRHEVSHERCSCRTARSSTRSARCTSTRRRCTSGPTSPRSDARGTWPSTRGPARRRTSP